MLPHYGPYYGRRPWSQAHPILRLISYPHNNCTYKFSYITHIYAEVQIQRAPLGAIKTQESWICLPVPVEGCIHIVNRLHSSTGLMFGSLSPEFLFHWQLSPPQSENYVPRIWPSPPLLLLSAPLTSAPTSPWTRECPF